MIPRSHFRPFEVKHLCVELKSSTLTKKLKMKFYFQKVKRERGVVNKCVCVGQFDIYHECVQKCGNVDGGEVSVPTLR